MRHRCKALDEVSRRMGIPKYQHHVTVHANGRMFFPVKVVEQFRLTPDYAFSSLQSEGEGCVLTLLPDAAQALPRHLRAAPGRSSPCLVVWREVARWLLQGGYSLPRRMRFQGPPIRQADGSLRLVLLPRAVRDLHAIAEQHQWFDAPQVGKI
jgi:hypothetical protein